MPYVWCGLLLQLSVFLEFVNFVTILCISHISKLYFANDLGYYIIDNNFYMIFSDHSFISLTNF